MLFVDGNHQAAEGGREKENNTECCHRRCQSPHTDTYTATHRRTNTLFIFLSRCFSFIPCIISFYTFSWCPTFLFPILHSINIVFLFLFSRAHTRLSYDISICAHSILRVYSIYVCIKYYDEFVVICNARCSGAPAHDYYFLVFASQPSVIISHIRVRFPVTDSDESVAVYVIQHNFSSASWSRMM